MMLSRYSTVKRAALVRLPTPAMKSGNKSLASISDPGRMRDRADRMLSTALATLVSFPYLGHAPQIQEPEMFNRLLASWVKTGGRTLESLKLNATIIR